MGCIGSIAADLCQGFQDVCDSLHFQDFRLFGLQASVGEQTSNARLGHRRRPGDSV